MTKRPRFATTKIAAGKSANEIGGLVAEHGARAFGVRFDDQRRPVALHFVMSVPEVGEVPVKLNLQIDGLYKRLYKEPRKKLNAKEIERKKMATREQAIRVAWRQMKAHVEMSLEMVENGLKPFHEAFMADVMIRAEDGSCLRLGDAYHQTRGNLALQPAPVEAVDTDYEVSDE